MWETRVREVKETSLKGYSILICIVGSVLIVCGVLQWTA